MCEMRNGEPVRDFGGEFSIFGGTGGFRGEPRDFSGELRTDERNELTVVESFSAEFLMTLLIGDAGSFVSPWDLDGDLG
jgi:hypothetical protein